MNNSGTEIKSYAVFNYALLSIEFIEFSLNEFYSVYFRLEITPGMQLAVSIKLVFHLFALKCYLAKSVVVERLTLQRMMMTSVNCSIFGSRPHSLPQQP